jgi:hypothetical protein
MNTTPSGIEPLLVSSESEYPEVQITGKSGRWLRR